MNDISIKRDKDILEAYRRLIRNWGNYPIRMPDVVDRLYQEPAPQFYVSAQTIARYYRRGFDKVIENAQKPHKKEMYTEIAKRFNSLLEDRATSQIDDIAEAVVNSPAPSYYLTKSYIRRLIYQVKQKRR